MSEQQLVDRFDHSLTMTYLAKLKGKTGPQRFAALQERVTEVLAANGAQVVFREVKEDPAAPWDAVVITKYESLDLYARVHRDAELAGLLSERDSLVDWHMLVPVVKTGGTEECS